MPSSNVKKRKAKKTNKKQKVKKGKATKKSQLKVPKTNISHVSTTSSGHPNSHIPIAHNQTLMVERRDQNDAKALAKINEDINTGRKVVSNLVSSKQKEVIDDVPKRKTESKAKYTDQERSQIRRENIKKMHESNRKKREAIANQTQAGLKEHEMTSRSKSKAVVLKPVQKPAIEKEPEKPIKTPTKSVPVDPFNTPPAKTKTEKLYEKYLSLGGDPIEGKLNFSNLTARIKVLNNGIVDDDVEIVRNAPIDPFYVPPTLIPDPGDYGVNPSDLSDSSDPTTIVDSNLPQLQDNTLQANFSGLSQGTGMNPFSSNNSDSMFID